ncbi:hypothetical protein G4B88_027898 [Cannabis sativa]|uniref:Disease resistance R13L4/SHOC-2-like LRR domain-containing protein n=1 Tax=Cannabis sativa TaxID=3483 RepID=A0A7J6I6E4_CANSA|nr:hypothetical protein G4B88_027898 [Cannabis sativa]
MGCCSSQHADSKASRLNRWRSTGIVALRDSKLKMFKSSTENLGCIAIIHDGSLLLLLYRFFSSTVDLLTFPEEVLNLERSVRTLDLTHNKIVDIPLDICKLINMQRLVLADNLIQSLPINLGKLQSLKVMTLDGNRISSLPDEFGQLVRLERLSISRNSLEYLPETIGSLRNLQLLDVSNNKLKSLPESIGSCFSLEELQANGKLFL